MHAVEEVPQLGPLIFRIPLAEIVTVREEALFRAGLFLVATCPTDASIELVFFDGVDEGRGLKTVAACVGTCFLLDFARVDGGLNAAHNEAGPKSFDEVVTKLDRFREVVACINVNKRHGMRPGANALAARWVTTMLSFPPEKRMAGRSNWAATSRST